MHDRTACTRRRAQLRTLSRQVAHFCRCLPAPLARRAVVREHPEWAAQMLPGEFQEALLARIDKMAGSTNGSSLTGPRKTLADLAE